MKRRIVRGKVPLRISFGGGGTDVAPYYVERGGVVLSCTIDKYAFGTIRKSDDHNVTIHSLDFDILVKYDVSEDIRVEGELSLVKAVLKHFSLNHGVEIFLHSDAPPGSGLGSSSAIATLVIGLLSAYTRTPMTDYEIAELAYQVERYDLQIPGGKQDQYACTFGGMNLIEFREDATIVNPLRVPRPVLNDLEYNLMLCYTGKTRLSGGLIEKQVKRYQDNKDDTVSAMDELKRLAYNMKDAILRGELRKFGGLLHDSGESKRRMNPHAYPKPIVSVYEAAREHGAIGGKILGAGAGGYLLLYADFDRRRELNEALKAINIVPVDFHFDYKGLQTWEAE